MLLGAGLPTPPVCNRMMTMLKRLMIIGLLLCTLVGILFAYFHFVAEPPLISAVRQANIKSVDRLIAAGVNVNQEGHKKQTALHAAILAENKEIYSKLLSSGADPNHCDNPGTSVVHLAAMQEDSFWLREALRHGGNPNLPNTGNRFYPDSTPIFYAISRKRPQNAILLIQSGADVNHKNAKGYVPFWDAFGQRRFSIASELIKAGADPTAKSAYYDLWSLDSNFKAHLGDDEKEPYQDLIKSLIEAGYLSESPPNKPLIERK